MRVDPHDSRPPRSRGYGRWVFWGFVLIAGYFLVTEHQAHVIQALPYLLVLACPLLHFFHGHGGHGRHEDKEAPERKSVDAEKAQPARKHGGCH